MLEKKAQDTTHFGFREVPTARKGELVSGVFDSVARRYDLMNDLMSAGVHRAWKARLIDWLNPRPGLNLLDIAGGTGDIAFRFIERCQRRNGGFGTGGEAVAICDINSNMLDVGRDRAIDRGFVDAISWTCGDAQALPFDDASFDAATIAFGIRNVTDIDRALAEAYRVLKPGGHFLCLEFSKTVLPGLSRLYDLYSFSVLPTLGHAITGDREAYQYLVESIRRFPNQSEFAAIITCAGFDNVRFINLTGGVAAIHAAWRI